MKRLLKEDCDTLVGACDVGLIFLDHRLSYMQAKLPNLAYTDPNTDIEKTITDGEFGWWNESNDSGKVGICQRKVISSNIAGKGKMRFFCKIITQYPQYITLL